MAPRRVPVTPPAWTSSRPRPFASSSPTSTSGRALAVAAAELYRDAGLGELLDVVAETDGAEAAYHLFVGMTPERDRLIETLAGAGIEARAYYTTPMHQQPALASYDRPDSLPNAERLAREGIALPMGPALDEGSVRAVVAEIERALSG